MFMLQGLLTSIFLATQAMALTFCNVTSYNTTVTIATTITPILTLFTTLNSIDIMTTNSQSTLTVTVTLPCPKFVARQADSAPFESAQISNTISGKYHSAPAFVKSQTRQPGAVSTGKPFPSFTNPTMAYNVVATTSATPVANCHAGGFSFLPAINCSSSAQISAYTVNNSTNPSTLSNTSTVMSITNSPTLSPTTNNTLTSDTAESTSTTIVVVSLTTSTEKSSATPASITTSTSAAHLRPQPVRAIFWLNLMLAKARGQVYNPFGDWVNAEKAKLFLDIVGDKQVACNLEDKE